MPIRQTNRKYVAHSRQAGAFRGSSARLDGIRRAMAAQPRNFGCVGWAKAQRASARAPCPRMHSVIAHSPLGALFARVERTPARPRRTLAPAVAGGRCRRHSLRNLWRASNSRVARPIRSADSWGASRPLAGTHWPLLSRDGRRLLTRRLVLQIWSFPQGLPGRGRHRGARLSRRWPWNRAGWANAVRRSGGAGRGRAGAARADARGRWRSRRAARTCGSSTRCATGRTARAACARTPAAACTSGTTPSASASTAPTSTLSVSEGRTGEKDYCGKC
jgi:hypothetical protein